MDLERFPLREPAVEEPSSLEPMEVLELILCSIWNCFESKEVVEPKLGFRA